MIMVLEHLAILESKESIKKKKKNQKIIENEEKYLVAKSQMGNNLNVKNNNWKGHIRHVLKSSVHNNTFLLITFGGC